MKDFLIKNKKIIIAHLTVLLLFALVIPFGCPFYKLTGIPCPGCGLTRAWLSAFRLDFSSAFLYNPLFFVIPIFMWVIMHINVFNFGFKKKYETVLVVFLFLIIMGVFIFRLYNGYATINLEQGLLYKIFIFLRRFLL